MTTIADLVRQVEDNLRAAERRRDDVLRRAHHLVDVGRAAGRSHLTPEQDREMTRIKAEYDRISPEIAELRGHIEELQRVRDDENDTDRKLRQVHRMNLGGAAKAESEPRWVRTHDQRPAAVLRGERFADHELVREAADRRATADAAVAGQHGSLGHLLRSMSTSSGSAIVPTIWSADIIDRARNVSAVLRSGAPIIPMDAKIVQIGRLTADPAAAFRAEGSTVTASDPTFDNVTLTATTLSALVVGSLEWFQDADNVDQVVTEAIAQAIALELDRQALFGGVIAGGEVGATGFNTTFPTPPNPRGVLATLLATASSSVLGSAANGTTQTAASYYAELLDAIYTPRYYNETPTAMIGNARLWRQYAGAADTTNQPLRAPADVEEIPRIISNQIPTFTQGTMTTRATDVFVGDWTQCLIGQRLDLSVQTLVERYAELGQVGIIAHWRGDVQLARPRAFAVYRYLQAAP